MKKFISFVLALILLSLPALAGWETFGNLEKLQVSSSPVKQYVFSEDGKFMFVLDNSNKLIKLDAYSGDEIWSKNLSGYSLKISPSADQYAVLSVLKNHDYFIKIFNIENDSLVLSSDINQTASYYIYDRMNLDYNFLDFAFTKSNLFFFEKGYSYYDHETRIEISDGIVRIFNFDNDTLNLVRTLPKMNAMSVDYDKSSKIVAGSFNYRRFVMGFDYTFRQHLAYYDIVNDTLNELNYEDQRSDTVYTNLRISGDGSYVFAQRDTKLLSYFTKPNRLINQVPFKIKISSMLCPNDHRYLFAASDNSITVLGAFDLAAVDTLVFPGLSKEISSLTYSPEDSNIYFKNINYICRFKPGYGTYPLKACFHADKNISFATDSIKFINGSGGSPDSYLWDFGDGSTSSEKEPFHAYSDTGYYDVKLIATKGSQSDTFLVSRAVHIQPFVKNQFSFEIFDSECPVRVQFTNKSTGAVDSVLWLFDDGSTSKESNPVHNYYYSKSYRVTLRLFSGNIVLDSTLSLGITLPDNPIDYNNFLYEYTFTRDKVSEALQGYETSTGEIVFNNLSGSNSSIICSNDFNSVKWQINKDPYSPNLLAKNLFSDDFLYSNSNALILLNKNGESLKSKILPPSYPNDFFKRILSNFGFDHKRIFAGSYARVNDLNQELQGCYLTELNSNLDVIDDTLLFSFEIPFEILQFTDKYNILYDWLGDKRDVVTRFWCRYWKSQGGWEPHVYEMGNIYINSKPFYYHSSDNHEESRYRNIYDAARLNYEKLIVIFNDSLLVAFDNKSDTTWTIELNKNIIYKKLLRLNDTAFIAAGSIYGQPGYVIYNDKGKILDSVVVSCRNGCFNHVSVTPDTNLLFSGYLYKDYYKYKQAYFVKTKSETIKSYITSLFKVTDSVYDLLPNDQIRILPNPTTASIVIHDREFAFGKLEIDLLNIYGNVVAKLYDGNFIGGELRFDLSCLADGMYLIRSNSEGKVKVTKLLKVN